jgi:hypothetical protein
MILTLEVDQAVRVVGPIVSRRKMELRAVEFLVCRSLREKRQRGDKEKSGSRQDPYSLAVASCWWLVAGGWLSVEGPDEGGPFASYWLRAMNGFEML